MGAAVSPQAALPSLAQPTPCTHCPQPPLVWDPSLVLRPVPTEPNTSELGGTRGASQRSAAALSTQLHPAGSQSSQQEGIKLGAVGAGGHSRDLKAGDGPKGALKGGGGERGCSECAGLGVSHSGARRVTGSAGHHCAAEKFLLSGSYGAAAAGGAPAGGGVTPSAGGGGCAAGGYMPLGAARGTRGPMRPPAMGAMPGGAAAPAG